MLLEQLVTAGTVTEICVWRLRRRYRRLLRKRQGTGRDEEGGRGDGLGRLRIGYFRPLSALRARGSAEGDDEEPVKSHLKLTAVDRGY